METRDMPEIRFENDVPWKRNRFGELYRKSDERNNGQFGWNKTISIATMTWNETGNGAADSSLASYKVLRTGDIAFEGHTNKEFQFGRFVLNDIGDGITSSIFTILRPTTNQNIIFWKYLIHDEAVMRRKLVYSTKSGIMMNGLVVDDFMKQTIRFPSLPVQREIADLFSSLDRKLAAEQKKLAALKMAKHALLVKIFPREGETVPEIRFEGFSHPWEQRKFRDIAIRESVIATSSSEIPSVEYDDVVAEEGILNKDIRQKKSRKTGIVFDGTQVLYGKLRPYLHNWLNPDFNGVAVGDWWVLKPVDIDKNFLYRIIQTRRFNNIANQSSGSKMPRADWNLISHSEFAVPSSKDEQAMIGVHFNNLDHLITLHQRKCDKLRQAKSALLNQMFV